MHCVSGTARYPSRRSPPKGEKVILAIATKRCGEPRESREGDTGQAAQRRHNNDDSNNEKKSNHFNAKN